MRGGAIPAEGVNPVEHPTVLAELWNWFCMLHECRTVGMSGPCRIGYSDMLAFFTLEGVRPEPWHIGVIKSLDRLFMASQHPSK